MIESASNRRLSFVLVEAVNQFGLGASGMEQLLGRSKTKTLARARQCVMAVLCDAFGMSLTEVGEFFERDHTTVHHARQRVRGFPDYERLLETVRRAFPGEHRPSHLSTDPGRVIQIAPQPSGVIPPLKSGLPDLPRQTLQRLRSSTAVKLSTDSGLPNNKHYVRKEDPERARARISRCA